MVLEESPPRVFKTAWFAKAATIAHLDDTELCAAIQQVMRGQAANLGGGVFKKRLDDNRRRSIVLAKTRRLWVYEYLFAKKDRDNITDDELAAFRAIAKGYAALSVAKVIELIRAKHFVEICHDDEA